MRMTAHCSLIWRPGRASHSRKSLGDDSARCRERHGARASDRAPRSIPRDGSSRRRRRSGPRSSGQALDPALFEMLAPAADRVVVEQKRMGDFLAVPPVVQKHQGVRAARAGLCGGGGNAWKADHQSGSEGPPVAVNSPSPRETTRRRVGKTKPSKVL
jgi:hypothetical protein